jgi:hypothetical protein
MLRFLALLILPVMILPALADDPPPAQHARMTWEQRFASANTAHDGQLTQEEAKAGYLAVARHFHEIDTEGKGYVTENDVRAWRATQKPTRPLKDPPEDPLRPRPAFRLVPADQGPANATDARALIKIGPDASDTGQH